MELLFLLVERRGELVTREDVADRLWGATVFVDVDQSINTAVRKVRMVLRDDPDKPRFIETVVGKGYCFAAPVVVNGEGAVSAKAGLPALPQHAQASQSAATEAAPAQRRHRRHPVLMLLAGGRGGACNFCIRLGGDPRSEHWKVGASGHQVARGPAFEKLVR